MRRVHGAPERRLGEIVHDARDASGRRRRDDDRRHRHAGEIASDAGRVSRMSRAAVRLLYAGHDHERDRSREEFARARRSDGSARPRRQHLPLHRLSQHRPRGAERRRTDGESHVMTATGIGASVKRFEDARFITGRGQYIDDIQQPGQVYAVFLRSPYARARIANVDANAAKDVDGVLAVLTGRDMVADGIGDLPCGWLVKSKDGSDMKQPPHPPLAAEFVNYVGEPYGVVVATSLAAAHEGADAVMTEFDE